MATPPNIRRINRRDVLMAVLRSGTSTRSTLARETGLSQPTTGKIVEELLEEGILESAAETIVPTRMGRPGMDVTLGTDRSYFIAIQLGVVHTRLAGLPVSPPERDEWDATFRTPRSMLPWLKQVSAAAKQLITPRTRAVLVSVPGVVDELTGRPLLSPNLRWLERQDLARALERVLALPVFAVQEMRCLALGQRSKHSSAESFLLVDFGVGVGAAAVLNGQLFQSQLPLSGELGHTPVPRNSLACGCGGTGCLETLVRRDRLLKLLKIDAEDWHGEWTRKAQSLTPTKLPREFRQALEAAAVGIAGALNVLGLERVVLTGYLAELPDVSLELIRTRIQAAAMAGRFGTVRIDVAPRRRLAGLASVGIERVLTPTT